MPIAETLRSRMLSAIAAVGALLGGVVTVAFIGCSGAGPVVTAGGRVVVPDSLSGPNAPTVGLFNQRRVDTGYLVQTRADMQRQVTLPRLLTVAANAHPGMREAKARLLAAEARRRDAGGLSNPILDFEAKFSVSHGARIADATWRAVWFQPLPLRSAEAREQAEFRRRAARQAALARALELELDVRLAFVTYWAAYRREETAARGERAARRMSEAVTQAVAAGVRPELDAVRARARWGRWQAAHAEAQLTLAHAGGRLREAVGDGTLPLGPPPATWAAPDAPKELVTPRREWAVNHPFVLARQAEAEAVQIGNGTTGLADEVVLGLGYEYEGHDRRHWVLAHLILGLPVFDRGGEERRAVAADAQAVYAQRDAEIVRLLARLGQLRDAEAAASRRQAAYEDLLLPAAQQEWEAQRGPADESDEEPADGSLEAAMAELTYLDVQMEAWQARAELARIRHELLVLLGP